MFFVGLAMIFQFLFQKNGQISNINAMQQFSKKFNILAYVTS